MAGGARAAAGCVRSELRHGGLRSRSRSGSCSRTSSLQHRPRVVVLAYFAGNDLFDAEAFDSFQRAGVDAADGAGMAHQAGGQPRRHVVRHERVAGGQPLVRTAPRRAARRRRKSRRASGPVGATAASFDRGMFTVPVDDRAVRFAFMPPYLNTLNFSEAELGARRGWRSPRRRFVTCGTSPGRLARSSSSSSFRSRVRCICRWSSMRLPRRNCERRYVLPRHLRTARRSRAPAPQPARAEQPDAASL